MTARAARAQTDDLFAAPAVAVANVGEAVRELRREVKYREWKYPQLVDAQRISAVQAERQLIALRKALALLEAIEAYLPHRHRLVERCAQLCAAPKPPTAATMEGASALVRWLEDRLRLNDPRLLAPAGTEATG